MWYTLGTGNLVLVTGTQDYRLLGQQLVAEATCDFCQKSHDPGGGHIVALWGIVALVGIMALGAAVILVGMVALFLRLRKPRIPASVFSFVSKSCMGLVLISLHYIILCL